MVDRREVLRIVGSDRLAGYKIKELDSVITFPERVDRWLCNTFGLIIARDPEERNHRFIEEALELVQANGYTKEQAQAALDYVYSRPLGAIKQEVGGVMVCLAGLCEAAKVNLFQACDEELLRCWENQEKIQAKHAAKPEAIRGKYRV